MFKWFAKLLREREGVMDLNLRKLLSSFTVDGRIGVDWLAENSDRFNTKTGVSHDGKYWMDSDTGKVYLAEGPLVRV